MTFVRTSCSKRIRQFSPHNHHVRLYGIGGAIRAVSTTGSMPKVAVFLVYHGFILALISPV
jgi:hypothetical protein